MCGIVGFNWEDKRLVKKMADAISHRGTDQDGYYAIGGLSSGQLLMGPRASGYSFVPIREWPVIPQAVIQSYDFTAVAN